MNENNITISEDVVVTITNIAAKEVKGVHGLHVGVGDLLERMTGASKWNGGVSVETTEDGVVASVIIDVVYGEKICEVAKLVQENIKNAIESMTERSVASVNVHVHSVVVSSDKTEK